MSKQWVQNQDQKHLLLLFIDFLQLDSIHFFGKLWFFLLFLEIAIGLFQQLKLTTGNGIS